MRSVTEKYTEDEIKQFKAYYGAHPDLLDGFKYAKNAETANFLSQLSETENDITP